MREGARVGVAFRRDWRKLGRSAHGEVRHFELKYEIALKNYYPDRNLTLDLRPHWILEFIHSSAMEYLYIPILFDNLENSLPPWRKILVARSMIV